MSSEVERRPSRPIERTAEPPEAARAFATLCRAAGLLGLVAGALLLIAGRRLFWLFVGLVGFFAGLRFAPAFLAGQPEWMQWLVAALFGVAGMFLAIVLQRFAVMLAGFLVGGLATARVAPGGDPT